MFTLTGWDFFTIYKILGRHWAIHLGVFQQSLNLILDVGLLLPRLSSSKPTETTRLCMSTRDVRQPWLAHTLASSSERKPWDEVVSSPDYPLSLVVLYPESRSVQLPHIIALYMLGTNVACARSTPWWSNQNWLVLNNSTIVLPIFYKTKGFTVKSHW